MLTKPAIEVYSHIYPPLAGFLWRLTPAMEAYVGTRLVPTYGYFRIYQQGDVCKVHSDRHACEHSLSLMLAASNGEAWGVVHWKELALRPDSNSGQRLRRRSIWNSADDAGGRRAVPRRAPPP